MQWFEIDAADGRIKGWTRSAKAEALPEDTESTEFRAATDDELALYTSLQAQAADDGRDTALIYEEGPILPQGPTLPEDDRLWCTLETDKTAFGVDETATLTFTAVDDSFGDTVNYALPNGRILSLAFTNGVAVKYYKAHQSERLLLASNALIKIDVPVTLEITE